MKRDRHGIIKSGVSFENLETTNHAEDRVKELEEENACLRAELRAVEAWARKVQSLIRQAIDSSNTVECNDVLGSLLSRTVQPAIVGAEAERAQARLAESEAAGEQASPASDQTPETIGEDPISGRR